MVKFESWPASENSIIICWKYTTLCNMKCGYCEIDNTIKSEKIYNKILKEKLMLDAAKNPDIEYLVDIEGGEPTLDKDVYNIYDGMSKNVKFKLFTNFKKPDVVKLAEFSKINKVEISLNTDLVNDKFYSNLSKVKPNKNIEIDILVTKSTGQKNLDNAMQIINDLGHRFFISEAEDFTKTEVELTKYRNLVLGQRAKKDNYGHRCCCNFIQIDSNSTEYTNCSNNFVGNFLTFSGPKYLKKTFRCRSRVCGIHDYQINFKKYKK